jgi:hypothetical protein
MIRTAEVTLEDGRVAEVDVEVPDTIKSNPTLAEKSSGLLREFSPFPTTMKQLQTPLSGRNPDVVTSPLEPLLALDKYGHQIREQAIGRVPEETIPQKIGKGALRLVTPFSPSDLGATASMVMPFVGAVPELTAGRITSGNVTGIPTVKGRVDEALTKIPSEIQSQTAVKPVLPTKAGQEIQSSFERGFGKQEAAFEQAHQEAVAAQDQAVKAAQAAKESIFNKGIDNVSAKYGSEPLGLQEAGKNIQKSFQAKLDKFRTKADELYKKLDVVSGKAPASPDGQPLQSQGFIKNVFEQRRIDSPNLDPKVAAQFEMFKNQLANQYGMSVSDVRQVLEQTDALAAQKFTSDALDQSTLNAYKMMNSVVGKLQNPNLTVHDLSLIGTDVNRFAYAKINDPIRNVYKALGGIIKEDIANGAEAAGFGNLSKNARTIWRNFKSLEESKTAKIVSSDPENIIPKIAKANSPTKVQELMANVDPAAQNDFRRAIIDHATEKSGGDIGKLAKELGSKTAETNKAIFGEDAPLIDRYAKFGKMIDEAKSVKVEVPKSEPFTPTETTTARIIRNQDAGNILDGLIGKGVDETRIKSAINGMDQQGIDALKGGLFQKIKDDPQTLNKVSDSILTAVYGKDAKLFQSYRQILNARDSNLKTGILKDIAKIVIPSWPAHWAQRAIGGFEGIVNKARFPTLAKEAQTSFPNLPIIASQKSVRPYVASVGVQSSRFPYVSNENR